MRAKQIFGLTTTDSRAKIWYQLNVLSTPVASSSQAKGTNSTSFLTHVRNEVELVPLACEDAVAYTAVRSKAAVLLLLIHF